MIIEFAGLPGAGKSTLRQALYEVLSSREINVLPRQTLRQQVIAKHVPFDRKGPLRKVSTASYKLMLGRRALTNGATRTKPAEWLQPHLLRASQRLIESQLILEFAREAMTHSNDWFDLDEGICQNFISLQVWRRLLRPKYSTGSYGWLEKHLRTQPHVLITLTIPPSAALERLDRRGRHSKWPKGLSTTDILQCYAEEMSKVDEILREKELEVRHFPVDATVAEVAWPKIVQELAETMLDVTGRSL